MENMDASVKTLPALWREGIWGLRVGPKHELRMWICHAQSNGPPVKFLYLGVTLFANSIGAISAMQAVIDKPNLYWGAVVVSPIIRSVQKLAIARGNVKQSPHGSQIIQIVVTLNGSIKTFGKGLPFFKR